MRVSPYPDNHQIRHWLLKLWYFAPMFYCAKSALSGFNYGLLPRKINRLEIWNFRIGNQSVLRPQFSEWECFLLTSMGMRRLTWSQAAQPDNLPPTKPLNRVIDPITWISNILVTNASFTSFNKWQITSDNKRQMKSMAPPKKPGAPWTRAEDAAFWLAS